MDDKFFVYHNGKPNLVLNEGLLRRQDCMENLEAIKAIHQRKLDLYDFIKDENDVSMLKTYAAALSACEFELQKLWKFTADIRFHRFWQTPKCACPQVDNEDRYPTGHYVITADCPLHGK